MKFKKKINLYWDIMKTEWLKVNRKTVGTVRYDHKVTSYYCNADFKTRKIQQYAISQYKEPTSEQISSLIAQCPSTLIYSPGLQITHSLTEHY